MGDEARLRAERLVLVALAAWSEGGDDLVATLEHSTGVALPAPGEALDMLAELTAARTRIVPRLVVLDLLVRLVTRRGLNLLVNGDAPNRLLVALAEEVSGVADPASVVERTIEAFRALSGLAEPRNAWATFAGAATQPLQLTTAEVNKPLCNDEHHVKAHGGPSARAIESTFWSELSVAQLAHWCDPRNWPHCSIYFLAMEQQGSLTPVSGPPGGWNGTFLEVVACGPGQPLETPLRFKYREEPDGSSVHTTYDLVAPTRDIAVDHGYVRADADTTGPPGTQTFVTALKVIAFTDPAIQQWSSIACDTFWTELLIDMTTDCGRYANPAPHP